MNKKPFHSRPKLPPHKIPFSRGSGEFFGNNTKFWVRVLGFRNPKKGEYYLSGAEVEAYQALNDMSSPYWIVEAVEDNPPEVLHEYAN